MRTANFKLVADDEDGDIPVSVAGSIMTDIQSLIVHIGAQSIEKEMLAVYRIPHDYLNRFVLHIKEVNGKSITLSTKVQDRFTGFVMDDAVEMLTAIMDADESALPELIVNMFPNPKYRAWIIQDLDALSHDITGYSISYDSVRGISGRFNGTSEDVFPRWTYPLPDDHLGAAVGLLHEDPIGRLRLTCDDEDVDLELPDNIDFFTDIGPCDGTPCTITGHLIFSKEGTLSEICDIADIQKTSSKRFSRIISRESDVSLSNPVEAAISYNPDSKAWIFSNSGLDISTTGHTWDESVRAFHDAFMCRLKSCFGREDGNPYYEQMRVYSPAFHD